MPCLSQERRHLLPSPRPNKYLSFPSVLDCNKCMYIRRLFVFWSTRPDHSHTRWWSLFSFTLSVRPFVRPYFSKQNKFQAKIMFATDETVGLAEWIIDDTCLVQIVSQKHLNLVHWTHYLNIRTSELKYLSTYCIAHAETEIWAQDEAQCKI